MKIKIEKNVKKTQMLCAFVQEGSDKPLGLKNFDVKTNSSIKQSVLDLNGKLGKLSIVPVPNSKQVERILLAGIGNKKEITKDTIRLVSGKISQKARDLKLKGFTIIVPPSSFNDQADSISQIVEGSKMSLYMFDKFKAKKSEKSPDLILLANKSKKTLSITKIS